MSKFTEKETKLHLLVMKRIHTDKYFNSLNRPLWGIELQYMVTEHASTLSSYGYGSYRKVPQGLSTQGIGTMTLQYRR